MEYIIIVGFGLLTIIGFGFFINKSKSRNRIPEREGLIKTFWDDGSLRCEKNYNNGLLNGLFKEWHTNGQLKVEVNISNDIIKTPFSKYYDNGQLEEECALSLWYDDNPFGGSTKYCKVSYSGENKKWYRNGNLMCEGFHKKGERDGNWKWYYENGKLKKEEKYGQSGIEKYYHENGKLKKEGDSDGLIWKHYHKNGKLYFKQMIHPPKKITLIGGWKSKKNSKKLNPLKGETEEIEIETWKGIDNKLISKNEIIKHLDENHFLVTANRGSMGLPSPSLTIINDFLIARSFNMGSHWLFSGELNNIKYEDGEKVESFEDNQNEKKVPKSKKQVITKSWNPENVSLIKSTKLYPEVTIPGYESLLNGLDHLYDGEIYLEQRKGELFNIPLLFKDPDDNLYYVLIFVETYSVGKKIIDYILEENWGKPFEKEHENEVWSYFHSGKFFSIGFMKKESCVRINTLHSLVAFKDL